jgi:ketosteroid isomerase-like protein
MKSLMGSVLFTCLCVAPVLADSAQAQSNEPALIDAIKQVEEDMGKAMVAGDVDKLSQIYADDFATIGSSGEISTKHDLLSDFASFHDKLLWFENGPMDVQVFGNVAVAQGSVKEKRNRNGRDSSGGFFGWISLRSPQANGWLCAAQAPGWLWPTRPERNPEIRRLSRPSRNSNRILGWQWWPSISTNSIRATPTTGQPFGSAGKIFTKQNLLSDFKSGDHRLVSFENGPMDVQVLGNLAVAQAGVKENRIQDGKDISGQFVFIDLLEKRAGKWVIVRTLGPRVG